MGWIVIVFSLGYGRHRQRIWIIHRIPRLWGEIFRMRIEETRPKEKVFTVLLIRFHECVGPLSNPSVVVVFFRNVPLAVLIACIPCRRREIVTPIGAAVLFHPDRIVLSDVCFVGMVPCEFDMLKPVKRFIETAPKVQILEDWVGFEGRELLCTVKGLKVRFSDEGSPIPRIRELFTHRMLIFREFRAEIPRPVLTRVFSSNNRGACRCAGRVRAVGSVEKRALLCQCVQVRGLDFRVEAAQSVPMLLIARNK